MPRKLPIKAALISMFSAAVATGPALLTSTAHADLQPDVPGNIETLPQQYPDHWMMVHDASFFHMFEGEVLIVDPLASTAAKQYKGMIPASFIASYERGTKRHEHYIAETFYSRGGRGGERTDVVTIWGADTLEVKAEVIIPPKRLSGMPKRTATALTPDEKFMLIYNFTPQQSVSVVDLEEQKFVAEVETPGCGFVIPTGKRSFTSICANGTLRTTHLDGDGNLKGSDVTDEVFDPNEDPIFEIAAVVDGVAYFPTFQGKILPVNVKRSKVRVAETWWLTAEDERNWRPGGIKPYATDSKGLAYFLMNPEGGEGTHKDGGAEVWAFDVESQKRVARIELANWGLSLGTSGTGDGQLLAVTNANLQVDVYRIPSGEFVHTLGIEPQTPFTIHGAH